MTIPLECYTNIIYNNMMKENNISWATKKKWTYCVKF